MGLTSLARVKKALRHEEPDIVPVGPFAGFYAARIAGVKIYDYITDGKVLAEAQHIMGEDRAGYCCNGLIIAMELRKVAFPLIEELSRKSCETVHL